MQFEESTTALMDQIQLSTLPPTQNGIDKVQWVEYRPLGQIQDNTPIDFIIPGSSDYIDLKRSFINVKLKILKTDNTTMGPDDHVSIINLPLHSMWNQVDVYLNQQLVGSSTNNYAYKAYMDTLLFHDKNVKDTRLKMQGWYKDSAGVMDSTDPYDASNTG